MSTRERPSGQELAREVELAVLEQVAVDLPFGLLGDADDLRVAVGAGLFIEGRRSSRVSLMRCVCWVLLSRRGRRG